MNRSVCIVAVLFMMFALATTTEAQMNLPHVISDGMVIQRDARAPIWGWSEPGTEIQVMFRDALYTGSADSVGKWRIELPPMQPGGPFEMRIVADDEMTTISNILIGDVWVCSGQSNMEWVVGDAMNAEEEIAAADDDGIRHFKVPRSWAWQPEEKLAGGSWEPASPGTVGDFTAVGYYFARELRKHVDVPIGLINTSWGGSRLEPWMSAAALKLTPADLDSVRKGVVAWEDEVRTYLVDKVGELPVEDRGHVEGDPVWADPDLDDSDWDTLEVPGLWEWSGYPGMDGVGWYRTSFELSEEEAESGARLSLGMIDDSDITWLNGERVGGMEMAWNQLREYDVNPSVLQPGRNVLAIRVEDTGGGGGIHGSPSQLYVESSGNRRSLAGAWAFNVGLIDINLEGFKIQVPTVLYNKMVHPLLDFPIKGVLWYQGESNTQTADAIEYRNQFKEMIQQWRSDWGVDDVPFLWVQLANYLEVKDEPSESDWAVLRESQSAALELPATAQAVIIDIGEADDIHPRNKQDVGLRLSLAARKLAYGEVDIVYSGPVYSGHEIHDGRVYLEFDHVGEGLVLRDLPEDVSGFAVAGPDSQFVWAKAELTDDGEGVVVWSDEVADPAAVRYAWADNPAGANLYNSAGLPASPFRTDPW